LISFDINLVVFSFRSFIVEFFVLEEISTSFVNSALLMPSITALKRCSGSLSLLYETSTGTAVLATSSFLGKTSIWRRALIRELFPVPVPPRKPMRTSQFFLRLRIAAVRLSASGEDKCHHRVF
jgi:hypothetical protein